MNLLLNFKNQKKALLKNSKNIKKIYDMYYEEEDYKIVYVDKVLIKKRNKYKVLEILKKFNIGSGNELIFLLLKFYGKKIRTCEYCHEDMKEIKLRSGWHREDCYHKGICILCKNPSTLLNKEKICYQCKPFINEPTEEHKKYYFRERLEYAIFSCHDLREIEQNYVMKEKKEEVYYVIDFILEKLQLFKSILKKIEGLSHGSEVSTDNTRGTGVRKNKGYLF